MVVAVGARSRQACARRRIPIPGRRVFDAARELLAVGTEAHGSDHVRMPPQRRELRASVRIPELDGPVVRAAGQDVLRGMERNTIHPPAEILRCQHLNNEL